MAASSSSPSARAASRRSPRTTPPEATLRPRFVLLSLGFFWLGAEEAAYVVIALILGFASVDPHRTPSGLRPGPRAVPEKPAPPPRRLVLTPGWLSGIVFFLLCVWIWITLAALAPTSGSSSLPSSEPDTMLTSLLSTANLFLFPLIFIHLFFPKHASGSFTFGIYFFIQACLAVLTLMIAVLSDAMSRYDDLIFALVPIPSVLLVAVENGGADREFELIYSAPRSSPSSSASPCPSCANARRCGNSSAISKPRDPCPCPTPAN